MNGIFYPGEWSAEYRGIIYLQANVLIVIEMGEERL